MSKIEWTEQTWNPTIGCTEVSPGCTNCYAVRMAYRLANIPAMKEDYAGLTRKLANGKIVWTGEVKMMHDRLREPLQTKKPTVWFVDSMSDLFHKDVEFNFIYKVFEVMLLTPLHTYQVLTKRADRLSILTDVYFHLHRNYPTYTFPLKNVWIGVSVESQKAADERIPHLVQTPAAVKFLSCEPLLDEVKLNKWIKAKLGDEGVTVFSPFHWVIVGGESGPGARPMHPDWARTLRNQCKAADVPFFFKQWGEWVAVDKPHDEPGSPKPLAGNEQWLNKSGGMGFHGEEVWRMRKAGKKKAGRLLDGQLHNELPGNS